MEIEQVTGIAPGAIIGQVMERASGPIIRQVMKSAPGAMARQALKTVSIDNVPLENSPLATSLLLHNADRNASTLEHTAVRSAFALALRPALELAAVEYAVANTPSAPVHTLNAPPRDPPKSAYFHDVLTRANVLLAENPRLKRMVALSKNGMRTKTAQPLTENEANEAIKDITAIATAVVHAINDYDRIHPANHRAYVEAAFNAAPSRLTVSADGATRTIPTCAYLSSEACQGEAKGMCEWTGDKCAPTGLAEVSHASSDQIGGDATRVLGDLAKRYTDVNRALLQRLSTSARKTMLQLSSNLKAPTPKRALMQVSNVMDWVAAALAGVVTAYALQNLLASQLTGAYGPAAMSALTAVGKAAAANVTKQAVQQMRK